jgi:hypothetical protein
LNSRYVSFTVVVVVDSVGEMVVEEDSLVLALLLILGARWRIAAGRRGDHRDGGGGEQYCGGEKTTEGGQRSLAMAAILLDPLSLETPSKGRGGSTRSC